MDLQFWIWVIILVVTFLVRATKKSAEKRQERGDGQGPETGQDTFDHKPISFEELLREIQASKTPEQPKQIQSSKPITQAKPYQKSYEVDYDEEIEEEEKDLETIPADDTRSYEVYEKAKTEAFHRPSLEETMKLSDTSMKYDHFKGYDSTTTEKSVAKDILADFKDPEGFKKAFIMSEILKRKF